eukprot:6068053-Ditylum_brightwellii.AAC.1
MAVRVQTSNIAYVSTYSILTLVSLCPFSHTCFPVNVIPLSLLPAPLPRCTLTDPYMLCTSLKNNNNTTRCKIPAPPPLTSTQRTLQPSLLRSLDSSSSSQNVGVE